LRELGDAKLDELTLPLGAYCAIFCADIGA
jgi:hypothetical protein